MTEPVDVPGGLASRLEFETLISDLSATLVTASDEAFDSAVQAALAAVATFFGADRSGLIEVQPDQRNARLVHTWYSHTLTERIEKTFNYAEQLPWACHTVIDRRQPIAVSSLSELPPEAARDRQVWEAWGTRSVLSVPIVIGESVSYVIAMNAMHREVQWPAGWLSRLELLGRIFVSSLNRRLALRALRESEARLGLVTRSASVIPWDIELSSGRIWVTPEGKETHGWSRDTEVTLEVLFATIHPDDVGHVQEVIDAIVASRSERTVEYRALMPGGGVKWIEARGCFHGAGPGGSEPHIMGISVDVTARKQEESERRAATAHLQTAVEIARLGFYRMRDAGQTVELDDSARQLLGIPPEEDARARAFWLEHVHPGDRDRVMDASVRAVAGRDNRVVGDYRYQHPVRGEIWLSHALRVAERDAAGNAISNVGVLQEITDRKRHEEAVRESEARLASAVDVALLGFYEILDGTRLSYLDGRCRDLFGIPADLKEGAEPVEFWALHIHPEDIRRVVDLQTQLNDGRLARAVASYRYTHPERGPLWLHQVTQVTARHSSGWAQKTIGVVRDVTEDTLRVEALRASEEVNRATFEQAAVGIAHVGLDGRWLRVNDILCANLGYTREELLATSFQAVTHPDDLAADLDRVRRSLAGKVGPSSFEKRYIRKDGAVIWANVAVSLARDGAGNPSHFIAVIDDITARKQAEETLAKAHAEVQRLRDQLERENVYLRQETKALKGPHQIVGRSHAISRALGDIEKVAPTLSTVLLLGETGTGKELFAEALHQRSLRRDRTMIRVNCAAIPVTLIESELFGRERGAYTGALSKQVGRFELANGSTIFLDEIGELPMDMQVKLLRVVQERQIERLGNPRPVPVDVRIITATNRDLEKDVRAGRFREDLYYRLSVFPVRIPPLRERREDIPLLVEALVEELAAKMGKRIESVRRASIEGLLAYAWPGNVRELRNVIERALILAAGPVLEIQVPAPGHRASSAPPPDQDVLDPARLLEVLEQTRWRIRGKDGAAERLGLKPTTLESRMAKLGIRRP